MPDDSPIPIAISKAAELAQVDQLPAAEAHLRAAIASSPREPRLRAALAVLLRARGAVAEAIASWREALVLDLTSAEMHYDLALTLLNVGRTAEAIPLLRRTIELEPEFPDAYLHLAAALQNQAGGGAAAATAESIELCRRAVAIDPENPDAHQLLGAFLVSQRQLEDAEHHLTKA